MTSKWTVYAAPMTAPVLAEITSDGKELDLPEAEGYEVAADRITLDDEVYRNMVATWLTLRADEEGFVLDRLRSQLDREVPVRLLLVSYPENGICHAIHLPAAVSEMDTDYAGLVVCGHRDFEHEIPMRRDFWFGPGLTNEKRRTLGFPPLVEES